MASALSPVSAAVYALLQSLAAPVTENVPQTPTFPFVWYELQERDLRGFGGGGLPEVQLRTHVFSTATSLKEGQDLNAQVVGRLKDAALQVSNYTQCGLVFYDDSIPLADQELNGLKVHEIVSSFRIYVEEA
jgi:hypothetical protein